jgi:mannitol-1-phosphate 5-dehydrogenase
MIRSDSGARSRVVIIGSGRIGCGYLASMFSEAGWEVVLAARTADTAAGIRAGGFTVRITGNGGVRRVSAVGVTVGTEAFERAVRDADLVATAVGAGAVAELAPHLARALAARPAGRRIDVWAVENADLGPQLETAVRRTVLEEALELPRVGFAGAIAFAAVSHGDWKRSPRPQFVSDTGRWLLVDEQRLVCPLPRLPRVGATRRYHEHLRAKRLVFSAGHALCAYLGARRGHRWVHEATADPLLRPLVEQAVRAARGALVRAYPQAGGAGVESPVAWALRRYANPELKDPVRRVARDPLRKLGPHGPLVGAARLVEAVTGRIPPGLAAGIAAALLYRDPTDAQAVELEQMLWRDGVAATLSQVCAIDHTEPLGREVIRHHDRMAEAERDITEAEAAAA